MVDDELRKIPRRADVVGEEESTLEPYVPHAPRASPMPARRHHWLRCDGGEDAAAREGGAALEEEAAVRTGASGGAREWEWEVAAARVRSGTRCGPRVCRTASGPFI